MKHAPSSAIKAVDLVADVLGLITTDVFEQRLTAAVAGSVPLRSQSHSESEQDAPNGVNNLRGKNDTSSS